MKKLLLIYLIFLFLTPSVVAVFFENQGSDKTAVFISKYSSKSMDLDTLMYYNEIYKDFSVHIVKDSSVWMNKPDWINAYEDADLIFITSLSKDALNTSKSTFCGNLSIALKGMKGIVFAGNSSIYHSDYTGCLYDPAFNLASPSESSGVRTNKVKIVAEHQITEGYELGSYNLSGENTVYTVESPINGMSLGNVNDDAFLCVWEGLAYRAATWGIETSNISDCEDCLGWKIFHQLLKWVSNTSDMGFKIETDKEVYTQGDIIYITVSAPAEIITISGTITDPSGKSYELSFFGEGKSRESNYLLSDEDPNGEYKITTIVDGIQKSKTILVKSFDLMMSIDNTTEAVSIGAETVTPSGDKVEVANITLTITTPLGSIQSFVFNDTSSANLIYNVTRSGEYRVYSKAVDKHGREDSEVGIFSFFLTPNVTFSPDHITKVVTGQKVLNFTVYVVNRGDEPIVNITLKPAGEIKDWILLGSTVLPDIDVGDYGVIDFFVSIPEAGVDTYTGRIDLMHKGGVESLPITIKIQYPDELLITPSAWEGKLILGKSEIVELRMDNVGKGDVFIESINVTGELKKYMSILDIPRSISPNKTRKMRIKVTTSGVSVQNLMTTLLGELTIRTRGGLHKSIPLKLLVVEDLTERLESMSNEVKRLEGEIIYLSGRYDVSDLRAELDDVKNELEDARRLFAQGEYESAVNVFNSLKNDLETLKDKIIQRQEELQERKKNVVKLILIIFALIIIFATFAFVLYIIKKGKEYSWLYKKWKG